MAAQHTIAFVFLAMVPLADCLGDGALLLVVPGAALLLAGGDAVLGAAAMHERIASGGFCRFLLWLYSPLQIIAIAWGAQEAASNAGPLRLVGLAIAIGFMGGVFGILCAHEMIHSRQPADRAFGTLMLAAVGCCHFRIAHLHLHHRFAATAADPATARCGESLYRFILRSVAGQFRGAWRLEQRRRSRRRFPVLGNRVALDTALALAIVVGLGVVFGPRAALFQLAQSAMAIIVLEAFNYVAHYGLARRLLPDGRSELLTPAHSWNTAHRFNNWALFNGGHHSDHHLAPSRPYHQLRALPETPMLPYGYAGTMLMALIPPLWRRVMDPRVAALSRRREAAAPLPQQPDRDRGVEDVPHDAVAEGSLV